MSVLYLLEFLWLMYAEDLCICVFSLQRGVVKGTVEFTRHILMLCSLFFFFIWFPNRVNVTHESIRDLTMFGMLILKRKFIE